MTPQSTCLSALASSFDAVLRTGLCHEAHFFVNVEITKALRQQSLQHDVEASSNEAAICIERQVSQAPRHVRTVQYSSSST